MTVPHTAPLHGLRILAVEQFGAGPFATMYLADMGAEVIKIEDPRMGGDVGRSVPPGRAGSDSLYFESFNRGKRSIALDLSTEAGRSIFERLVAEADAVFNNLRGDLVERMRLDHAALGSINPRIVCASLSAYDRHGPRASHPGYDALMQAEAGWANLTGAPDDPPTKSGLSLVDYAAGLAAALGLVAALFDARQTGRGRDVDTSLYDVAVALLTYPATWYLSAGIVTERQPMSAHPSIVPFQFFATTDGTLAVACAKDKFFGSLVRAMDLPDLLEDPRFASMVERDRHRTELLSLLAGRFAQESTACWLERLAGVVPCAPARPYTEALDASETAGMVVTYPHPLFGQVRAVGSPIRIGGYEPRYSRAPGLDADRDALLNELGYNVEEIAALEEGGAFGTL